MAELLHRLGTWAARRAGAVILAWVALLAIAVGGFAIGFRGLSSSFDIPGTASPRSAATRSTVMAEMSFAANTAEGRSGRESSWFAAARAMSSS